MPFGLNCVPRLPYLSSKAPFLMAELVTNIVFSLISHGIHFKFGGLSKDFKLTEMLR